MFEERTYREIMKKDGFVSFSVCEDESDLFIMARNDLTAEALELLKEVRADLLSYIRRDSKFAKTLEPYRTFGETPLIARKMAESASRFGVGPMAAVAGAIAEYVGGKLSAKHGEIIIENGGDIYVNCRGPMTFGLYAGRSSPFANKLKFTVPAQSASFGVCTSSGMFGHSLSLGKADAACVICASAVDADSAATAFCNMVKKKEDVDKVIECARQFKEIKGIIVAKDDRLGLYGNIELI